ncbi:VanZ family protein [Priestia abyssalis]|uniref:VanZ family protein n=1 Tax=Priestia abyssalis TaxID=1221450 RepID=UPI001474A443|nr:VanZ family protein [Priestia abyssalis]
MRKRLLILLMLSIFYTSNTPGLRVTEPATWISLPALKEDVSLFSILEPGSRFYNPVELELDLEFLARKLVHLISFGLLAFLFYCNLRDRRGRYMLAGLLTAIFAFTDEVHQAFILNRDGRLTDVILDTVSGVVVMLILYRIKQMKRDD